MQGATSVVRIWSHKSFFKGPFFFLVGSISCCVGGGFYILSNKAISNAALAFLAENVPMYLLAILVSTMACKTLRNHVFDLQHTAPIVSTSLVPQS